MIYKYKITLRQQFYLLVTPIIKYGIWGLTYLYFFGFHLDDLGYLYIFLFFFLFDLLPAIILHIQYLHCNWKATLIVDTNNKTFIYKSKRLNIRKGFNEIEACKYVASYGGGKSTGYYSFGEYRYCKFIFKDGTEVVITCLMVNRIQRTLQPYFAEAFEKQLKILALIR